MLQVSKSKYLFDPLQRFIFAWLCCLGVLCLKCPIKVYRDYIQSLFVYQFTFVCNMFILIKVEESRDE